MKRSVLRAESVLEDSERLNQVFCHVKLFLEVTFYNLQYKIYLYTFKTFTKVGDNNAHLFTDDSQFYFGLNENFGFEFLNKLVSFSQKQTSAKMDSYFLAIQVNNISIYKNCSNT